MRRMSTGNGRWFVVGITLVAIIVAGSYRRFIIPAKWAV